MGLERSEWNNPDGGSGMGVGLKAVISNSNFFNLRTQFRKGITPIKDGKHFYNRGVFVFPSGEVEYYDKRKSFGMADEPLFFTAGKQAKIVEYLGWKINLQICYDLRFPTISLNTLGVNSLLTFFVSG